ERGDYVCLYACCVRGASLCARRVARYGSVCPVLYEWSDHRDPPLEFLGPLWAPLQLSTVEAHHRLDRYRPTHCVDHCDGNRYSLLIGICGGHLELPVAVLHQHFCGFDAPDRDLGVVCNL